MCPPDETPAPSEGDASAWLPHVKCLVVMPFGRDRSARMISNLIYEHKLLPVLDAAIPGPKRVIRIDQSASADHPINHELERHLRKADLVLADVSGNNPNVLFELGYRRALGLPFVCVSSDREVAAWWPNHFPIYDITDEGATRNVVQAIKNALVRHQLRSGMSRAMEAIYSELQDPSMLDNQLKARFASWRIRRAARSMQHIKGGDWLVPTLQPVHYAAHLFAESMCHLSSGDEYVTVTNMDFWRAEAMGDTEFLDQNRAACQRGATIRRVFLIGTEELKKNIKTIRTVLSRHAEACDISYKHMEVRVLESSEIDRDQRRFEHFGLMRSSREAGHRNNVLVLPRYPAGAERVDLASLQWLFSSDEAHGNDRTLWERYEQMFKQAFELGEPVSVYLKRIQGDGPPPRA